ncbi:M36 family metallopeptidase [Micromonospora sp. NPDC006431]|uniref:M36 family metallopeptidase n=1 Tax=Micromonospora sp. NPDC006431 TaxID=3364235 RepID=UPI0036BD53E2
MSYLRAHPGDFGVAAGDLSDLAVASSSTSPHNGVTHVNLAQRHKDLDVFGAVTTVSIARDGSVIFVGGAGTLVSGLSEKASGAPSLDAVEAVQAAADGLDLADPANPKVMSRSDGAAKRTVVSGSGISDQPIPAKLGWQPTDDGLRLAWQLVIDDSSDTHLWNASVDAQTGKLLNADDWTTHENTAEIASNLGRTATSAPPLSAANPSSPNPVQDGSSYRVFNAPKESPNDGPRTLVTNPADADASPHGWHDTNGAAGAEHTTTQGNNVHAYQDQDNNNAPDVGSSPDGGANLTFDFPMDLGEHAQNYRDAATANLFYWNNIVHDISHRYGFDEAAGNFQANNYGRGGTGGDYVRAEAADGGGTNNANFSTPGMDGGTPRMQMYLWPGTQFGSPNQVVVDGVGSFDASWSRFTPAPTKAGLAGHQLVYAGTGCTAAAYPATLPSGGWISVVDGGTTACTYLQRAQVAQAAGAKALVVAHNATGTAPVLTGAMTTAPVTIPAVAVTQADGATIKAAIAAGTATGSVRMHPNHPGIRDGDLDAGVIIHEYTHGISNRLTGGPTVNCLSGNEQMGEGWSDYVALTMLLDPKFDTADGQRGMGPYVLFQDDRHGGGIRPRPYSRNMDIQPFTYDSIKTGGWLNGTSLAAPHGIGHGWTSVLWDMTWNLIDRHGFNPNIYDGWNTGGNNLALQLVIDGLKLQGCGPGFVTGRNAIIAADAALTGGENACILWGSFARRGLGYSAVQGTTARDDNTEAFDTHPSCRGDFVGRSAQPALNTVVAGDAAPMKFKLAADRGLNILASGSPYSRLVDCDTLKTVNPSGATTPRPTPVAARNPGGSSLSVSTPGQYNYPWKTDPSWAGTCREFVLTLDNGFQYRAYFKFTS